MYRLTLSKVEGDYAWQLCSPRVAKATLDTDTLQSAIKALVQTLSTAIQPTALEGVFGPEDLVDAFLSTWITHIHATTPGLTITLPDPYFRSSCSYASLATLPPPSPSSSSSPNYHISLCSPDAEPDIVSASHFYIAFAAHGPVPPSFSEAHALMLSNARAGWLWLCRIEGEIAGYTSVGRVTPRTLAIRNVYVAPSYRRRGVAEAMVRAVSRHYLGAEFEGAPEPAARVRAPGGGRKRLAEHDPGLAARLGALVDPDTRGDPMSPLVWTTKSTRNLAEALTDRLLAHNKEHLPWA